MKTESSVTNHKLWPEVAPYLHIDEYRREGGEINPRFRIQLMRTPDELLAKFLSIKVKCVSCRKSIFPFRLNTRHSKRFPAYFAATCPLNVNIACSRGKKATEEYKRIKRELGK